MSTLPFRKCFEDNDKQVPKAVLNAEIKMERVEREPKPLNITLYVRSCYQVPQIFTTNALVEVLVEDT